MRRPFDDGYTREPVSLAGRAPHDVLDQRLFSARFGYADVLAQVQVQQVWGRGRYEGRQDQYLEVLIEEVFMGRLPKRTAEQQVLRVRGSEELPGSLKGQQMLLFLRWAPGEQPPYHHHLMPADAELMAHVRAMIEHAKREGVLDKHAHKRRHRIDEDQ